MEITSYIVDEMKISNGDWSEKRGRHCVNISYQELKKRYKNPHAWVFAGVEKWEDTSYYTHPKGVVIWVKNVEPSWNGRQ